MANNHPNPVRLYSPDEEEFDALVKKWGIPASDVLRRCVRLFLDAVKRDGYEKVLAKTNHVTSPRDYRTARKSDGNKLPPAPATIHSVAKRKARRLTDVREISMFILSSIPAGWPDERVAVKAKREVKVAKGRFPEGAFGLDVIGESMNAAKGQFGPVLDGETVVLLAPDRREPKHGDIVAALCDGRTTLKRLWCKPKPCVLRAESTAPEFANCIRPAHDLVIQGVVIGKL